MARPGGQLERSLAALTIGVQQSRGFRDRSLADGHTGEHEQQVHVQISGVAGIDWAYADQAISFEVPFVYAPLQRRVPYLRPHFTHGVEMLNASGTLVQTEVHVTDWDTSDEGWTIGATVRFGVSAPMATDASVPYSYIAHLSFQGYASYAEENEFANDAE